MSIDPLIVDYSAGVLLRYFRGGAAIAGDVPRLEHKRDVDLLKGHWAVSGPVRTLIRYLLTNPHETQSLLTFRRRVDDAIARGRMDAIRTWSYRIQSGLPSAIVAEEPVRSFITGPNLLLAWVLREAAIYTARLSSWQGLGSPYIDVIEQAQREMRLVHKIESLRDPIRAVTLGQRPGHGAVRTAARARQRIYRHAFVAYQLLQGVERGDPEAMNTVARTALIAPLESWRRFELAVALAAGEALSITSGTQLQIHLLSGDSSGPIITAGRFAVHWQQRTQHYITPILEPSEAITRNILKAYNLSNGGDRPDLIVIDQQNNKVASVIEVKYLAGDTASARFREAVDQIVRYARGYAPLGQTAPLISRSLVVLSQGAPLLMNTDADVPASVDFAGIIRDELLTWANRLTGQSSF
ncbi:hypothetical protein [Pseudochrobactrum saccharolyticum]|uniref:hypothetical protein n=1 Tax=Pseudochrobactrum saccharolyticum TaxID=354352 RepID=UPI00276497A4|nr:hypothetical protein [Pseudochrobactrum saccharolyticum]MDP8249636.1 hypothetical protein [Pseudochrobactrum saccharolyticum]